MTASIPIFPTRLYGKTLDMSGWRGALLADIAAWRREAPATMGRSERGGWHSPTGAHRRPAFRPVVEAALKLATAAYGAEGYIAGSSARLVEMWANVLPAGGWHAPHSHLPSLWSGVLHVSAPPGSPPLEFEDPRPAAEGARPLFAPGRAPAQGTWREEAEEGRMLLFPGWLRHHVGPHAGGGERVAVSFNFRQAPPRPAVKPMPARPERAPRYELVAGLLSAEERGRVLDLVETGWEPAAVGGRGVDPATRDSGVQWLRLDDPAWRWLRDRLGAAAERVRLDGALGDLDIRGGPQPAQVARYGPGQMYRPHRDRGPQAPARTLSCAVTLQDADLGGGTRFPEAPRPRTCAKPGDALFFRADELHEATPVLEGERVTLVVWYESAPP